MRVPSTRSKARTADTLVVMVPPAEAQVYVTLGLGGSGLGAPGAQWQAIAAMSISVHVRNPPLHRPGRATRGQAARLPRSPPNPLGPPPRAWLLSARRVPAPG